MVPKAGAPNVGTDVAGVEGKPNWGLTCAPKAGAVVVAEACPKREVPVEVPVAGALDTG